MTTPTKEQIEEVAFEMWKIGQFAKKQEKLYKGARYYWENLMSINMKCRLKQKARIAIETWEKIRGK